MSIRPVDFNGMIQRTQDVSTLKQNEDNRPVVEQQTIFSQEMKKVEQNLHQVVHAREKENAGYRYDAKEKGNGRSQHLTCHRYQVWKLPIPAQDHQSPDYRIRIHPA